MHTQPFAYFAWRLFAVQHHTFHAPLPGCVLIIHTFPWHQAHRCMNRPLEKPTVTGPRTDIPCKRWIHRLPTALLGFAEGWIQKP